MSKAQHTPGPWSFSSKGGSNGTVLSGDFVIARCQRIDGDEWKQQSRANARLIAAAPELLEALNELLARSENFHAANVAFKDFDAARCAMEKARAAIAKATEGAK